jgi:hypothetical protein
MVRSAVVMNEIISALAALFFSVPKRDNASKERIKLKAIALSSSTIIIGM